MSGLGSGTKNDLGVRTKVLPALKASGVRYGFDATDDFMKVFVGKASVKKASGADKVSVKSAENVGKGSGKPAPRVGKTSEKILSVISRNPRITIPQLSERVGVTPRSVERHIRNLQQRGLLKRVGGRKQGEWEVIG